MSHDEAAAIPSIKGKKPVITGVSGYFFGNTVDLANGPISIGRDPRVSQLVFPGDKADIISRRHCTIAFDRQADCFLLEDCWTTNGTFLSSGKQIQPGDPVKLSSGSRFYLGNPNYMFEVRLE